jgi:acetyl esterase/lipase
MLTSYDLLHTLHCYSNAARYGVSPDHLISLGCSAGGWTSTTLAIAAEEEWRDEMIGHDPTLSSTNLGVSSKVQAAVVMSGGPQAYDQLAMAQGAAYMSPYDKTGARAARHVSPAPSHTFGTLARSTPALIMLPVPTYSPLSWTYYYTVYSFEVVHTQ